ncbi:hypothetical protein BCF74_11097 [Knoellia remsis]|uniref:Uncharacterized protein n=1 Tax=Knoellia remsis TaxID=407159 RepID=A0A2T0UN71_9MICO|nr:hypothetical protein BCF74_11097 [Knoellia remsis]
MVDATDLRSRARRWRRSAERTREEVGTLGVVAQLSWRGRTADEFRRVISVRVRELRELGEREDAVADLLDRVADRVEQAA